MAAVGPKGTLILSAVFYLLCTVQAAPVDEGGPSQALQLSESIADARGCYYNFEHYGEGDRILTNEPCLNCTCHNRMLMCYLRVCPFTKAIGQDCTVEKKPDQCCPIITCPQVPVALLTSSTTSETPPTTTALGRPDNYGCILEDKTFYADGAQVPSDPRKPCELCYCIRNHSACVMQECTLNVEGCKPVYQEGICCPVRYDCDYDDVATTTKPTVGLVTTPGGPSECLHNGRIYHDGAMVLKDEKAPCQHCYCMRGKIVCAVQKCGTPLEGTDCIPMEPKHGHCCPNYKCANGTNSIGSGESSTESLPQSSTTEPYEHVKHGSGEESSAESSSNESSEESQEEYGSGTSKPIDNEHESISHTQETSPTYAPDQPSVSDESSVSPAKEEYTKQPETTEIVTTEVPLQENNLQQAGDSISEATQEQDVTHVHEETTNHEDNQDKGSINEQEIVQEPTPKTEDETTEKQNVNPDQEVILEQETPYVQEAGSEPELTHVQDTTSGQDATHVQEASGEQQAVPEQESQTKTPSAVVKDSDVTNEIPESTPSEHSEVTTEEPASEAARVPGEGSCLIEGKTYAHNAVIPNENPCQESCRCYSSIVSCKPKDCPPPPTQFEHCMPITTPGSCCPTYMCDQKPSDAPEVQNQLVDKNDDPSSAEQEDEHVGATQETSENEHKDLANGPVVEGIPPDNLVPGSHEDEVPEAQPQEVPEVLTVDQSGDSADIPSSNLNEDDNVNSDVVHGLDVAIHEGQLDPTENKDETANRPSPPEGTTTVEPVIPVKSDDNAQDTATPQEPESSSVSTTDKDAVQEEEVTQKQESYTVLPLDDELPQTPFYITTIGPNEEKTVQPQETGNVDSENVETNYSDIPATAVNYEPEVTTLYQGLQENQAEYNTPTTVDSQPEENNDSIIDESKHVENLATSKPVEESTYSGAEGEVHTDPSQYVTTQHTTEISEPVSSGENESQVENDSEQTQTDQEQTTISQQNVYSEGVPEVPTETSISNDNGESNDLPNGKPDETPNIGSEESAPSEDTSSPQEDAVTTSNGISLVSEGSESPATLSSEVNDETPTPSSEEVSNAISSNEKSTEASTSQALAEENETNSDDLETVQTTIRYETVALTSENAQAESEAQEVNNDVSSSTETATSTDSTTLIPLKNGDEKIVETTTFHEVKESTEQTSEKTVHSDVVHEDSSVPSGEPQLEEVTGQTPGSGTETSTEVKSEETASQAPLEVTVPTNTQDDNENNLHKNSSPEIIFEVVTNSGMPSIESHVTEGTLDHSIHQINNLADSDTLHTTENSQPLKTPVIEEQSSYHPPNPEISIELAPTTNKPVAEQSTDQTTVDPHKLPSVESTHNEVTSTHHETSTEELSSDVAPTTQISNQEGLSHQVNEEISPNTNEATTHETPEAPIQTTVPPEIVKENDNSQASSEQLSSDSISEGNEKIDSAHNEILSQVSDDEKNEIAPPEVQPTDAPTEEPQHISTGEVTTESANEVSEKKTTTISPTEAIPTEIQNEPNLEDNSEADSINHPQTDTPLFEDNVGEDQVEQKPSYLQPGTEDGPYVPQEDTSTANEELSTSPISSIEDKFPTKSPIEISQDTSHYEIVQEPTTETTLHTQQENVSEDNISAVDTTDTSKQSVTEVTPEEVALHSSSESPELPLSDNKEAITEVTTEHLLEVKPEQTSTPLVSTIDEESSTSHVEAIPQTDNTESSSINIPEETPNGSEDSHVAQVTHVENIVPPAPDSESHILDTSATEGETSTKATEETTSMPQATLDNHQDETIEPQKPHPNEIKKDQAETEQVKPDETPTNEVEVEQAQPEGNPSNEFETDLPHTPVVPETEQPHPDQIPTNHVATEQTQPDEVPSKPVESEQPHTDETTTNQVETEPSLPAEVPTNQVETEQNLPDEIKTDQAETELTHSDEIEPPHTTNEIPTNQAETEQPNTAEEPSHQVETGQSHTDDVPTNQIETEGPQYAEVPIHQAQTEQPQTDEVPAGLPQTEQPLTPEVLADPVQTEQPMTAEIPANQVQTEQPLTAEVPTDQVQTEQPLTAVVPADQIQTEQPLTPEVLADPVQTEQPMTPEIPANQVQTEQPLTAEVPTDQVQTEQPLTAEVPADQIQTEQPLTPEVLADPVQTERPLTAEIPANQVQTEQPLTAEVPIDQVQTEQPLTAEVPIDQVQTEQPLTAEVPVDQVQTEQPMTAEVPADQIQTEQPLTPEVLADPVQTEQPMTPEIPANQVQTEQPLTAEVPIDQVQTEQPLTAEVPVDQVQTEQPMTAEVPAGQPQTEQPQTAEVPADKVQTEQPLTSEVPTNQIQTEQPLTPEVIADPVQTEQPMTPEIPANQVQTEQPLTAEVPIDQVQTEQPLTAEVPVDQVQTEQPMTAEVPAEQVQTEQPLSVEVTADQVHADDTPVNQVESELSPSEETPTNQVETEQPHTLAEVPQDQLQTEQPQTAEVPDQGQTGQSHTDDTPVNEAETGLLPSEETPTDQAQTESISNILHSEDAPEIPVSNVAESTEKLPEMVDHEVSSMHPDTHANFTTQKPFTESPQVGSSQSTEHSSPSDDNSQTTPKEPTLVTQKIEPDVGTEKPDQKPVTESIPTLPEKSPEDLTGLNQPTDQNANGQSVSPSTETSILTEILSSTLKPSPVYHEEGPSFPTWSQKPFEHHTTPEPHPPEDSHYPNGFDPEYEDEEGVSYGPGTCRYGGKVYLSAQQIPRDDPCDFCFCFRSDIICLQQSCPPPIRGCYQETIKGFCCPRYECHVSMATMLNITTTTTTTTTTLPPHFFAHAYNGAATKTGCQVKGVAYSVGERIPSTSGPCLECRCGSSGQMKCDPTVCGPQEALLRQVMDAAVSRRR